MPDRERELKEGYYIFFAISLDDKGFEKVAVKLQDQINEAEKTFEINFLSGATYRDDPAGRAIYFAAQSAVLKSKGYTKHPSLRGQKKEE
jgi:hypothetical protein